MGEYEALISLAAAKVRGEVAGGHRSAPVIEFSASVPSAFEANRVRFRDLLWDTQRGICALCDKDIRKRYYATLDHVYPRAKGGGHWLGNLLLMHKECNHQKADAAPGRALLSRLEQINAQLELLHGPAIFASDSDTRPKDGDAKQAPLASSAGRRHRPDPTGR